MLTTLHEADAASSRGASDELPRTRHLWRSRFIVSAAQTLPYTEKDVFHPPYFACLDSCTRYSIDPSFLAFYQVIRCCSCKACRISRISSGDFLNRCAI